MDFELCVTFTEITSPFVPVKFTFEYLGQKEVQGSTGPFPALLLLIRFSDLLFSSQIVVSSEAGYPAKQADRFNVMFSPPKIESELGSLDGTIGATRYVVLGVIVGYFVAFCKIRNTT